jgi:hypothetical protein
MELSILAISAITSTAVAVPVAQNPGAQSSRGPCPCPTFGPDGTCILKQMIGLGGDDPYSAVSSSASSFILTVTDSS